MILISESAAILIFIVIIVIALLIAWYMKDYASYEVTWFHTFIAVLTGLGVFITFLFYYNLLILQGQDQQREGLEELEAINNLYIKSILKSMRKTSTIVPNFILSMTPLIPSINNILITSEDPITPETLVVKMTLSLRIFYFWQHVIYRILSEIPHVRNLDDINHTIDFLQKANSEQLYEQWKIFKYTFYDYTQIYGDLLFKYGLPITVQTTESYINAANELLNDTDYKNIKI